jgi:hypothetical protein
MLAGFARRLAPCGGIAKPGAPTRQIPVVVPCLAGNVSSSLDLIVFRKPEHYRMINDPFAIFDGVLNRFVFSVELSIGKIKRIKNNNLMINDGLSGLHFSTIPSGLCSERHVVRHTWP